MDKNLFKKKNFQTIAFYPHMCTYIIIFQFYMIHIFAKVSNIFGSSKCKTSTYRFPIVEIIIYRLETYEAFEKSFFSSL